VKPNQMLAHYRVGEKIGAGGMGEVYRATDTVLGREVALKILPPEFAADTDRMARFQREAKVLASLNHPNIAAIYGFESTDDCTFLAMELVEGDDLSEVLKSGPLSWEEAVDVARQIAEGLEEAHEKGIIHRDLKPANVKRTADGKVKVLDFGLARAFSGETAGEGDPSSAATMTAAMTQTGTVLGTAAYMSPEQARGKDLDRRADIWAFGVVLFEMLTGKQLFAGETASDTLAGILKTEPDWNTLPDGLPFQVERVLRRCLSKEARQRLRDIGEARVRLEDPTAESGMFSGPMEAVHLPEGRRPLGFIPWILLAASLAFAGWMTFGRSEATVERPYLHLAIPAPTDAQFEIGGSYPGLPAISPDGRHIAFSAQAESDNTIQLYVRSIDTGDAVALDGTHDAQYPFWSPDGQWIGFFDRKEGLKKIMVGGGPSQTVCDAVNAKGGSWNEDGQIIFTPEYNASLYVVSALGGQAKQITDVTAEDGFDSHRHPQFLPDGRHFLYLARGTGGQDSEIRLGSLDGGDPKVVMRSVTNVEYANGYLLYLNQRTLMAQVFDLDTAELVGQPVPVADDIMLIMGAAKGVFSASREGSLVFMRGKRQLESSLSWLDRTGREIAPVGDLGDYGTVKLSPDNKRAALTVIDRQAGTQDLWVLEIARNFRTRLTNHPAEETYPVWSPDGRALYFVSDRNGFYEVFRRNIGGTGEAEKILALDTATLLWDISPDGRTLLYSIVGEETGLDLYSIDVDGSSEPRLLRRTPMDDGVAFFSPDGNWISFWSQEAGEGQVYLTPWPGLDHISQVSTTTGTWSFWHPNGRELLFQEEGGGMMTVTLTPADGYLDISAPVPLFDHAGVQLEGNWLDLAADGERFLAVNSYESDPPTHCDLVIGWPGRLQQP